MEDALADGVVFFPAAGVGDDLFDHVGLTLVVPAVEQIVVDADGEEDIGIDILAGQLAFETLVLLLERAFDFAIDGGAFEGMLAGDEHELVIFSDGLIDFGPEGPAGAGVVVPFPARDDADAGPAAAEFLNSRTGRSA